MDMKDDFLYKYRGVDNEVFDRDIEALKNNYFWSSDVEHLNDDQEFQFNSKALVNTLDALRLKHPRCYQSIDNVKVQLKGIIEKVKTAGIFSLSCNPHVPSMWGLYASERKGYCIIYRRDKLLEYTGGICKNDKILLNVKYTKSVPTLSPDDLKGNELLVKLVATKEQSWSYEEETRIVTDCSGRHEIPASALCGIIFGSQMSEKDKLKIKDALVGRNVKFYQLSRKVDAYGYEHCLVDENKVCSSLDDSFYDYKCKSMPVVDNFFVKLKFMPSSEVEVINFISEFKKKHADRQCNIYVHDMDVDMEKFKEDYENYDYLQKHLIAEVYFDTDEVLFNSEYRKI